LASTSLLEGLVFGASVADFCGSDEGRELASQAAHRCGPSTESLVRVSQPNSKSSLSDEALAARTLDLLGQVKQTMWDHVGVVRNRTGLKHAVVTLEAIRDEVLTLPLTLRDTAALRDAAFAGHAVAQFAYANPVSAGAHCVVEAASAVDETGATLDDSDEEDQAAEARF
jgi:L-aspartate oxidase